MAEYAPPGLLNYLNQNKGGAKKSLGSFTPTPVQGPTYGPPSGVINGNTFLNPNQTPEQKQQNDLNSIMNTLQNPGVTTQSSQDAAAARLQGMGIDPSSLGIGSNQQNDPYSNLQQQLQAQVANINVQPMTPEQLQSMAQTQANMAYDPAISALQGQIQRTQDQGNTSIDKTHQIYNALGTQLGSELPAIQQQDQAAQDASKQQYATMQNNVNSQYASQAQQQQDMMNKLGIQAAQGDPRTQQTATDQQYFQNSNARDAQHQQDALQQIAATNQGYQRSLADNAHYAGNNAATDLQQQLNSYLGAANDKLSGLVGQKASDITNLVNQLRQSDYSRVANLNNQAFDKAMEMNNFQLSSMNSQNTQNYQKGLLDLRQQNLERQLANSKNTNILGNSSGLDGASHFLAQQYPQDTGKATQLENLLGQVLSQPDVISGKQPGTDAAGAATMNNMTNEYVMQQLRNIASKNGVGGGDINNLIDSYLAYKGQLH